jgi:glycine/D-amino acid oxidase-like deaminating enzyme
MSDDVKVDAELHSQLDSKLDSKLNTQLDAQLDFDVAICGAGPVGMALAAFLARRGVAGGRIALVDGKSLGQAIERGSEIAWPGAAGHSSTTSAPGPPSPPRPRPSTRSTSRAAATWDAA